MKQRELEIGTHVIFIDSQRRRINALVQAVHGNLRTHEGKLIVPCVNLAFLSPDASRTDTYGRQIEHVTSCNHASDQHPVVGYCWHWPDEEIVIDEASIMTKR